MSVRPLYRSARGAAVAVAAMAGLLSAPPAGAQGDVAAARDEPWIFIVHQGDELGAYGEAMLLRPDVDLETARRKYAATDDAKWYGLMADNRPWRAGPDGSPQFHAWIAEHQRAWDEVEGCFGAPLEQKTMVLSERIFDLAFDWMLDEGVGLSALARRPRGARVEEAMIGVKELPGHANYITCKRGGFMSTTNIGPNSANRLAVGPATNALVRRMPTFHLSAAHELGHLVQNNLAPARRVAEAAPRRANNALWVFEGAADAVGVMHAQDHYGKEYFGPYSNKYYRRFFLSRAYNVPLNLPPDRIEEGSRAGPAQTRLLESIDAKTRGIIDYQSNGFWYHVIERYLAGEPGGLNRIYRRLTPSELVGNATRLVDAALDSVDGRLDGLEHIHPQFLAEYITWPGHRFDGRMSEEKWRELGFGGCVEAVIRPGSDVAEVSFDLAEYAGACVRVSISPASALMRPDLQIRLDGPDVMIDEVYLAWAEGGAFRDNPGVEDCHELAERRGATAPCLFSPNDGLFRGSRRRFFYLPEIRQEGPRKDTEFLFVLSWVPQALEDVGRDFDIEEIDVTFSLDRAGFQAGGPGGGGPSGEEKPGITEHATKRDRAPVAAEGETPPGEATPRDMFTGAVATTPRSLPPRMTQALNRGMETSFTVRLDAQGDVPANEAPAATFFLKRTPRPGETGAFEVFAASRNGSRTGTQNPDRPSQFVIEEYSDETLRFRGVAHVCEGDALALTAARKGADYCELFPPRSYRVSGAIAFPTARNSAARLKPAPASAAYRKYQDLRLARIETRLGAPGLLTDPGRADPDPAPGKASGVGLWDRTRESCDCGCGSPDRESGGLRCKLLCGKAWKRCPAR